LPLPLFVQENGSGYPVMSPNLFNVSSSPFRHWNAGLARFRAFRFSATVESLHGEASGRATPTFLLDLPQHLVTNRTEKMVLHCSPPGNQMKSFSVLTTDWKGRGL
jgi:hypothetical protein